MKQPAASHPGKICTKCLSFKEADKFGKESRAKDGLRSACTSCRVKGNAPWNKANADRKAIYGKRYREANREYVKIKQWAYALLNPEKIAAKKARRRAAELRRVPAWADKLEIVQVYEACELMTLVTGVPHEVDHILPLRGKYVSGLHVASNLQIITRTENRSKANKWVPE